MTHEGLTVGQLEAFIQVARLGNVTLAGETLTKTPAKLQAKGKHELGNGTGSATFYVQLIPTTPAGGVQGAGTGAGNGSGASPSQGVLGAAVTQPNTGLNDWAKSMMIALAMVVLGTALLLRQAFSESAATGSH